jgi:hypothetical protein
LSASTRPWTVPTAVPSFWRAMFEATTRPPASVIAFWAFA